MTRLILICLGGAVGTGARYLTALWAVAAFGPAFPLGTFIVNVTGSLLLGFIMQVSTTTTLIGPDVRLMLTTGVMGGFTTYSTFNYETTNYLREGAWLMGAANIAATVAGCLVAGLAGIALARLLGAR
jgi:CrcB protein